MTIETHFNAATQSTANGTEALISENSSAKIRSFAELLVGEVSAVLQDQERYDPTAAIARHKWRGGQWLQIQTKPRKVIRQER